MILTFLGKRKKSQQAVIHYYSISVQATEGEAVVYFGDQAMLWVLWSYFDQTIE